MSTRDDLILWLDLETTGSADDADVLEVGLYLTDVHGAEIDQLSLTVWPRDLRRLLTMDPVVVDMHLKSMLVDEVISAPDVITPDGVEPALLRFLDAYVKKGDLIPLAGSGVSHFDRKYIRRDWPAFDKRLTYWAYDVGVIRRALRLAGREIESPSDAIAHRALADAQAHAREFFGYLAELRKIA